MLAPELIVFDHAPVALLAARSIGIPRVVFGTGFCSPPRVAPMPTIRPWEDVSMRRLEASEQRALDTANAVMRAVGGERLNFFCDLFDVEENILATLPGLDHYGARESVRYWGPLIEDDGDMPRWPNGDGEKVFVYLRPSSPSFERIALALRVSPQKTLWFAPGLSAEAECRLRTESLSFVRRPQRMSSVVEKANLAVICGGHGTSAVLFTKGIPMLLVPQNVEQLLLSRRIEAWGAGRLVTVNTLIDGGALPSQIAHVTGGMPRPCGLGSLVDRLEQLDSVGASRMSKRCVDAPACIT
jgi:UDP:flavonoid glycosyltransferase YjiC (YdhE family)